MRQLLKSISLGLLTALIIGCVSVGTVILPKNRLGFNSAVLVSEEQQFLLNIVRVQFEDRPYFLSVESVTTSNTLESALSENATYTTSPTRLSETNWDGAGNVLLKTLSRTTSVGGLYGLSPDIGPNFAYSDTPTVSYSPLQGTKFTQQILSTVSLNSLHLLLASGLPPSKVFRCLLENIDGLDNASILVPNLVPEYSKFIELVNYITELQQKRIIYFGEGLITHTSKPSKNNVEVHEKKPSSPASMRTIHVKGKVKISPTPSLDMIIDERYAHTPQVHKLYKMLGLRNSPSIIHLVENRAIANRQDAIVYMRLRSFFSMLDYLSNAVEYYPEWARQGLIVAPKLPDGTYFNLNNITKGVLHIYLSPKRPERNANVMVYYRGFWFYIADNDYQSKRTFAMITQIFRLQAGEMHGQKPVLTIPVG